MRRHTYPPDFRYIDDAKLDSVMGRLAKDARTVEELLKGSKPAEQPAARAELIRTLADMESAASALDTGGQQSNHPEIDRNIAGFRRNIEVARLAAEHEPPSFLLAEAITSACLHCHSGAP